MSTGLPATELYYVLEVSIFMTSFCMGFTVSRVGRSQPHTIELHSRCLLATIIFERIVELQGKTES